MSQLTIRRIAMSAMAVASPHSAPAGGDQPRP